MRRGIWAFSFIITTGLVKIDLSTLTVIMLKYSNNIPT